MIETDYLIIGGGIAGASMGYFLAPHTRVVLLEREDQCGYHSTGRSAALCMDSYGPPQIRALSRASRLFFEHPPSGFSARPLLSGRGALAIAVEGDEEAFEDHWRLLSSQSSANARLSAAEAVTYLPVLRSEKVIAAAYEQSAADIDVDSLHQGFLRGFRRDGGSLATNYEVTAIRALDSGRWRLTVNHMTYETGVIINAAGAWCDAMARLARIAPLGLIAKRRSAFTFAAPLDLAFAEWPLAFGLDNSWYMKPDAGMLLGSPANADAVEPQDVQPEELDVATGAYRIEEMTSLAVRPKRTWAGLRTFSPDGGVVAGFDGSAPGFFWLAGQGGYGIQTSAALGEVAASLALQVAPKSSWAEMGISPPDLSPSRRSLSAK